MQKSTLLFLALLVGQNLFSQLNISHIFSSNHTHPGECDIVDIDGDGDNDLLAHEGSTNQLLWFENTDGNGNFNAVHNIANVSSAFRMELVDLDKDNDLDVLFLKGAVHGIRNYNGMKTRMGQGWIWKAIPFLVWEMWARVPYLQIWTKTAIWM